MDKTVFFLDNDRVPEGKGDTELTDLAAAAPRI